ncbi:hypothetical protein DVDV_0098 [Desulfovibrio sp. DV]|nr:hypothetical protein DVDV_0098 [Desulfovibrio sp. DV]
MRRWVLCLLVLFAAALSGSPALAGDEARIYDAKGRYQAG